jgi:hypothetical protein
MPCIDLFTRNCTILGLHVRRAVSCERRRASAQPVVYAAFRLPQQTVTSDRRPKRRVVNYTLTNAIAQRRRHPTTTTTHCRFLSSTSDQSHQPRPPTAINRRPQVGKQLAELVREPAAAGAGAGAHRARGPQEGPEMQGAAQGASGAARRAPRTRVMKGGRSGHGPCTRRGACVPLERSPSPSPVCLLPCHSGWPNHQPGSI